MSNILKDNNLICEEMPVEVQEDMIEWLIAHGANVNAKDNRSQTPLELAKRRNKEEIVKLLLKHGAKE